MHRGKTIEVVGFKLKTNPLTTSYHFRRDKGKTTTFITFVTAVCNFLIPSTSNHPLQKRWDTANSNNEGRHIGIKKFSNWLLEMHLKIISNQGKQSILEEVKRRKFLNHLEHYIDATLIPQIKEDQSYKYLAQQAELCEVWKQHIVVPAIITIILF